MGVGKFVISWVVFSVIALLVSGYSIQRSPVFQTCRDPKTYEQDNAGGESPNDAPDLLDCAVAAIDANHDLILAFGTLFIAVFTGTLWKVNLDQAAVTPLLERAYVFAKVKLKQPIFPTHEGTVPSPIRVYFPNRGKTPAMLVQLRAYAYVVEKIPTKLIDHPGSERELPQGLVIKADGMWVDVVGARITHKELGQIERLERTLVCVGRIRYRDIFDIKRETGFCWHYQHSYARAGTFIITPDTPLNYYR